MRKYLFFFFFLINYSGFLHAQIPDSLAEAKFLTDTITNLLLPEQTSETVAEKPKKGILRFFTANYPKPGKAALFSFLVPGMGQVYNKKFWKVPIVYTGVGTMIYFIGKNGRNYKRFRTAYRYQVDDDESTVADPTLTANYQNDRLKDTRDLFRKRREQSYIGLIAVLALSSADAFVDAHLLQFNVSDDLSLRVEPKVRSTFGQGLSYGVGLKFNLAN